MKVRLSLPAVLVLALALPLAAGSGETTIESPDGLLRMTIPADWETLELNPTAEIQVGNLEQSAYLIVLIERKVDLFGWNIQRHSYVTLGSLLSSVDLPTITGPKSLEVGGFPAVQYEIRGASSGTNLVYLHTTIETPSFFAQVIAWTMPSQESAMRQKLEKAISSIRQLD
jgi:hypothetical protein